MSSVDERVVDMKFNNDEFGRKAADTIGVLGRLKSALGFGGGARGLDEATRGMGNMQNQVGGLMNSFSGLQAMAFGAFASIGSRAAMAGEQMAKSLSIAPITSGFQEYSTNLNSIQTILANTKASGADLDDVNKALGQLNEYSDQTIYNFGQMASAIGMFTASGVDLETSVQSIKGIANLAALSGSSAEQAAGLYRQLSQAISAGRVSLMDWNSVMTANMAGTVFQRALAQTAVAMGELDESSVKLSGSMKNVTIDGKSFRESMDATKGPSWLTSDVLVNTLRTFTGDMKAAELAAMGFDQAAIDGIISQANTAKSAAQDVKTISQAFDIAQETAGSGWSYTWQQIMGDFEEAKTTFTGFSNWINGFIKRNADARNEMLKIWKKNDGRKNLITALVSAGHTLQFILGNIAKAWRDIFPATTGYQLAHLTKVFKEFIQGLRPSREALDNIRRVFAGLFAVLGIGWELIKAGAGFIRDLLSSLFDGSGGVLDFTANIGDFLVGLHKAIKEGKIFQKFFDTVAKFLKPVVELIRKIGGIIADIFTGVDDKQVNGSADALERMAEIGANLGEVADSAAEAWGRFMDFLGRVADKIAPVFKAIWGWIGDIGSAIGDFLSTITFKDIVAGVATGAFATLVASLRKFLKNFDLKDLFGGTNEFLDTLKSNLKQLTDTLKAMQNALNAAALLAIAVAIGVLTVAVMALAKIPADDLAKASAALGTLLTELAAASFVFGKLKFSSVGKLIPIGLALLFIATAMVIFTKAIEKLSKIDYIKLQKGIITLGEMLIVVGGFLKLMSIGKTRSMIRASLGMIALAVAINMLVDAVTDLQKLDWEDLSRGLAGVAGMLTALGLFTKFGDVNKMGVGSGLGLLALAGALVVMGKAMKDLSKMDWEEIGKGLTGMAGGLALIVAAIKILPAKGTMSKATGILILVGALLLLGKVLQDMAGMTWQEVARALTTVAGALGIMVGALKAIQKAIPGALALAIVSVSLLILAEALEKMGGMSWADIGAALFTMGIALLIIGGLFALIASTGIGVPLMLLFAVALIGVAGALWIMSFALEKMGAMSWSDIGAALGGLLLLFIVLAVGGVLSPLIAALAIALLPLAGAIWLLGKAIYAAGEGFFLFAQAMERLAALDAKQIDNIVNVLKRLIELLPSLATAAADAIIAFVTELGNGAPEMGAAVSKMIAELARVMREDTPVIVAAWGDMMIECMKELGNRMPDMIREGSKLVNNFLVGMEAEIPKTVANASKLIQTFITAIGKEAGPIADAAAGAVVDFLNGLAAAIREHSAEIKAAAANIGDAILDGILQGTKHEGKRQSIFGSITSLATGALSAGASALGINSPSKEFAKQGESIVEGMALGASQNHGSVFEQVGKMALGALATTAKALGINSPSKEFAKLGKWGVLGFAKGLKDAQTRREVQDAYDGMSDDLLEFMKNTKDRIKEIEEERKRLKEDGLTGKEQKQYDELGKQIAKLRGEYNKTKSARDFLLKSLDDENAKLKNMASRYQTVTDKLEDAQQKLADARQTRDDYNKSIDEQYKQAPDFDGKTNLDKFKYDFEQRIKKTQEFATAIQELRRNGLNDDLYKQLLSQGPDALPFVQQILAGGSDAIKELNGMQSQLTKEADDLGDKTSQSLYQAGVNAAKGLVDGLKKEQKAIDDYMEKIAKNMAAQLKKALGIKSPSRVMMEIGNYTGQGLAKGMEQSAPIIERSTQKVGASAIDGMRKTLAGLGDLISTEMDTTPVVRPVLDLTGVAKDASILDKMMTVKPIDIRSTVIGAKDASAGLEANIAALEALAEAQAGDHLSFTQNNYSPKALSSADIYRQTNNQLSRVKK